MTSLSSTPKAYHVVLCPGVLPQVQIKATLPLQPLSTDVADKVLLHCVLDHVFLQGVLVRASLVAFGTIHNLTFSLFRHKSMISLEKNFNFNPVNFDICEDLYLFVFPQVLTDLE